MPNSWSGSRLDLHIELDATGGRRSGLESALRAAIRQGRLAAGTLLPSTRGLAQELGLSRGTVSAAYDQLVEEGYLTTRPGSGTTVVEVPPCDPVPARPAPALTIPRHDFRPGLPDVSAFPTRAWPASTRRVLTHAYDRHTRAARLRYRRRRELLLDRIAAVPSLTPHGVPAGLHTLITLPSDGPTEQQLLTSCARHGLALRGLTELHHDPADRPQGLLIGFAASSEHAYPAALDTLFTTLTSDRAGAPASEGAYVSATCSQPHQDLLV